MTSKWHHQWWRFFFFFFLSFLAFPFFQFKPSSSNGYRTRHFAQAQTYWRKEIQLQKEMVWNWLILYLFLFNSPQWNDEMRMNLFCVIQADTILLFPLSCPWFSFIFLMKNLLYSHHFPAVLSSAVSPPWPSSAPRRSTQCAAEEDSSSAEHSDSTWETSPGVLRVFCFVLLCFMFIHEC